MQDPEIQAMADISAILNSIEEDARKRVLKWLSQKYSIGASEIASRIVNEQAELSAFQSVADLFSRAEMKTEADKALIVSVYLQEVERKTELTGYEINKELTHLGHGVKNITSAIQSLIEKKPRLMIQTRKEGKSKQAQKKYRVTIEGIKRAKEMIISAENRTE